MITKALFSVKSILKVSMLAAFVSGARFIYMFYFSTIDTSNQKGVADLVFINGNNALFISLFSTLVLIPLAQFKKYNLWGITIFILSAVLVSFIWHLVYYYDYTIVFLMIFVMLSNLFYETTRRILYISNESSLKILDITISFIYLFTLGIFILLKKDIYYYLFITSLFVLVFSFILFFKSDKEEFSSTNLSTFFKFNHSGVGQSLLMFISGNFIFQLVSFYGSTQVFTKVNIIRIWITPVGLILNALDFVYSRDKYTGNVSSYLLSFTLVLSTILLYFLNDETALYCTAFFMVIPFQFWLRGHQIKLRQNVKHKQIWKINLSFTIYSIIASTIIVSFFHWKFWSWYLLLVYLIIWITWRVGKKKELTN